MNFSTRMARFGAGKLLSFYLAVSGLLFFVIEISGSCWVKLSGPGSDLQLHDLCLSVWTYSWICWPFWLLIYLIAACKIPGGTKNLKFAKIIIISLSLAGLIFESCCWWALTHLTVS